MFKGFKIFFLALCLFFSSSDLYAQNVSAGRQVKRNVAAVLFASLGGAVLGLSTLPFYGEPQEHTGNITTGLLVGFVGGLAFVAYDNTRPVSPSYDYTFEELEQKRKRAFSSSEKAPVFNVTFDF